MIEQKITEILKAEFSPEILQVVNDSHKHAGHAEAGDGGDTHFRIIISLDAVEGETRIQKHRKIYSALDEFIGEPVHALQIVFK